MLPLSHVCSDRTQKLLKPPEESISEGAAVACHCQEPTPVAEKTCPFICRD